jgi:hypothetical protein
MTLTVGLGIVAISINASANCYSFIPKGGVYDVYPSPNSRYLVYNRDVNGNEAFQVTTPSAKARRLLVQRTSHPTTFVHEGSVEP